MAHRNSSHVKESKSWVMDSTLSLGGQITSTRNNNRRKSIYVSRPHSMKKAPKKHICSVKTKPSAPEHNLPAREKNPLEKAGLKVMSCLPTPFLHAKLLTFQCIQVRDNDRQLHQEGGMAASNVCLQALPLSLPSPLDFFTLSSNREPVHRLIPYGPSAWVLFNFFLFFFFFLDFDHSIRAIFSYISDKKLVSNITDYFLKIFISL